MNYAKLHSKTRAEAKKYLFFGRLRDLGTCASLGTHPVGASKLCGGATS